MQQKNNNEHTCTIEHPADRMRAIQSRAKEFVDEAEASTKIAACAILNDKQHHGLFISIDSASLAGLNAAGLEHNLITYVSARGDKVPGYLFTNPSFVVVRESPLLMRVHANEGDTTGSVYKYDAQTYRQFKDTTFGTGRKKFSKATTLSRWLIILLNEDGRPLHLKPFRLPLGGRMSIALGGGYVHKQRQAFNQIFWQDASKTGSSRFNSLIINRPEFRLGESSQTDQLVCVVGPPQKIDEDNYLDWFVGQDKEVKETIFKIFDETSDFMKAADYVHSEPSANPVANPVAKAEGGSQESDLSDGDRIGRYNASASKTPVEQDRLIDEDEIPF